MQKQPPKPSKSKHVRKEEENARILGSAAGGAVLGASLGGPFGALIGGIIGFFFGEAASGEKRKHGRK